MTAEQYIDLAEKLLTMDKFDIAKTLAELELESKMQAIDDFSNLLKEKQNES